MGPFLPARHLLQHLRRRLVKHLNAGEIWQAPDLLGQGAVCPLYNLLKAFRICGFSHEANFTTRTSGERLAGCPSFAFFAKSGIRNSAPHRFDQRAPLRCAGQRGEGPNAARKDSSSILAITQFWQSWQSSYPCSTINSWQVMQYRLHGTAVNRFALMSWPQWRHSPNVPLLIRPSAASTSSSSPRSCAFCRKVISFDIDAVARSASSRPKSWASLCSSWVRLRLRRSSSRFLLRSSSNFAILAFSMRNHSTIEIRTACYAQRGRLFNILIEI